MAAASWYACPVMRRSISQLDFLSLFRERKAPPAIGRKKSLVPDAELTAWAAEASNKLALPELSRKVIVCWNPRMQTTAGRAFWPDRVIELNPKLRECDPDEVWRTLKHELAHLVAYQRGGRRRIEPHGREWQTACADLGIGGEKACHTLPFKRRRLTRKHTYVCGNCQSAIHRVRLITKPVACYECCRKFNAGAYHDRFKLMKIHP